MGVLSVSNFKGAVPGMSAKLIPNDYGAVVTNADLIGGNLKATYEATLEGTVQKSTPAFIFKCGTKWDCWASLVSVVRSWIYDANPRFYITDGSQPKQTKLDLINDCTSSGTATDYYYLGVTAPTTAPSLTLTYDGGSPGDDIQATIGYVFTYVTSWGEESAPSPASTITEIYDDGYCTVSCPTPAGEYPADSLITKIRIYRLNAGSAGAEYQYLTEETIVGTPTDYDDRDGSNYAITPDADLDDVITTETYDPPPADLDGIVSWANGLMAGFSNNKVYINEPFIPYAYPSENKKEVESDIVALGYIPGSNALVITTETHPYIAVGTDPYSIVPAKLENVGKNMSRQGTISTPKGVLYPSPSGLVLVTTNGAETVTKNVYTREQWSDLGPGDLIGAYYKEKYYGFFSGTANGIIYDFDERHVVSIVVNNYPSGYSVDVLDVYVDPGTDTLFLLVLSSDTNYYILEYEGSSSDKIASTFQSKEWSGGLTNYSCGRIKAAYADAEVVTFTLYVDGVYKHGANIGSQDIFRLPAGFLAHDWYFTVSADIDIDEVAIAEDPSEFSDG